LLWYSLDDDRVAKRAALSLGLGTKRRQSDGHRVWFFTEAECEKARAEVQRRGPRNGQGESAEYKARHLYLGSVRNARMRKQKESNQRTGQHQEQMIARWAAEFLRDGRVSTLEDGIALASEAMSKVPARADKLTPFLEHAPITNEWRAQYVREQAQRNIASFIIAESSAQ